MMPLIYKPIIQYVVEELVEAGITDIIIVGNSNKRSIEDHFDLPSEELLVNLRAGGEKKAHFIEEINAIATMANFVYIRQKGPYGNATPLLCAAHLLSDDEPFIYTFADDFFASNPGSTMQLIETYKHYQGSVLACKKVEKDAEYDKYGIAAGAIVEDGVLKVDHIDEKPGKDRAQSDLASVSEYLFVPEMIAYLKQLEANYDGVGELTFQPAVQQMIDDGFDIYARQIKNGKFYDTGDKLEYLKTIIDFGLAHKSLGEDLRNYIKTKI